MKITYNKNPLRTTVELDEQDKAAFRIKILLKEYEDFFYEAYFTTKSHDWLNSIANDPTKVLTHEQRLAQVADRLDYWMDPEDGTKTKLNEHVDTLQQHYIEELMSSHCGDCTCVPCSCIKCHAESILGIDTIPGVGKHLLYKIAGAFGKNNEKTIDEAIESLANYVVIAPTDPEKIAAWELAGGYEQYIPRWTAEAKQAHDWLANYRETHFKD